MSKVVALSLIFALNNEEGYWLISITEDYDPISTNQENYLECYRKELVGASAAIKIKEIIMMNIDNIVYDCHNEGYQLEIPKKGISYDLPLNLIEMIFDFWFDAYKDNNIWDKAIGLIRSRRNIYYTNNLIERCFNGKTAELAYKINELHDFRPNKPINTYCSLDPMWSS